jgi:hypothetical protein
VNIQADPVANVLAEAIPEASAEVLADRLPDVLGDILTDVWQIIVKISPAGQMLVISSPSRVSLEDTPCSY